MPTPVILITGASRGLGRGIAEFCAAEGLSVAVNYCGNAQAAADCVAACQHKAKHSDQVFHAVQGDISDGASREALLDTVWELFGSCDVLVNNAGIAPQQRADILTATEDSFQQLMTTNLIGPYFLTQSFAQRLLKQKNDILPGGPKVIFVTSISSHTASVSRGDYCVSKAGLSMAVQLYAARLAEYGIGVYEVRPGIMKTDMTAAVTSKYDDLIANGLVPQGRWGTPDDLGRAVSSLVRGDFAFSTGTVIDVDGGFHLRRL